MIYSRTITNYDNSQTIHRARWINRAGWAEIQLTQVVSKTKQMVVVSAFLRSWMMRNSES